MLRAYEGRVKKVELQGEALAGGLQLEGHLQDKPDNVHVSYDSWPACACHMLHQPLIAHANQRLLPAMQGFCWRQPTLHREGRQHALGGSMPGVPSQGLEPELILRSYLAL